MTYPDPDHLELHHTMNKYWMELETGEVAEVDEWDEPLTHSGEYNVDRQWWEKVTAIKEDDNEDEW